MRLLSQVGSAGKVRWVLVGIALLIALSAAPVLADAPGDSSPIPAEGAATLPIGAETSAGTQLPTQQQMEATFEEVERKLGEEAAQLETPAAIAAREASLHAFADLSPAEAEDLLKSKFAAVLANLENDPARFLSDAKLNRPLGEHAAEVTSEGKTSVMEGPMPVEAENDAGKMEKVDLGLEKTAEGWSPANPLVEVAIPAAAEEAVQVGEEGVAIAQVGAEDSAGREMGGKNVFFGDVEAGADTDLLVSPTSAGVEMFDLLRSVDSPQTLRFQIEVPAGARLAPSAAGGAEVLGEDGVAIAEVPAPTAVDAQGRNVPVSMEVEGDSLVLHVEHREEEVAYPILVDPEVLENWYASWYNNQGLAGLNAWGWNEYQSGWLHHGFEDTSWPGHKGLMIATEPGSLPANQWGQWVYSAPNAASYLSNAYLYPFWRNNRNCSAPNPYNQPYDYDGMWNETSWNRLLTNQANELGWSNLESWGRALIVGMSTNNGIYIPCWRDLMVGGAEIWLEDWDAPHLNEVSGIPTGWVRKDNTQRTISASATDAGLGVQAIRFISPGGKEWNWNQAFCAGTYESPCATTRSGQITYETSGFPFEGESVPVSVQAIDPTGKKYNPWSYTMKLDGTSPKVNLSGQLANVTAEAGEKEKPQGEGSDKLSLPVYNVTVKAEDGSASEPRSGTREINLYLDGSSTPLKTKTETCSSGTCPRLVTLEYPLVLTGLSEGKHTLEIAATDLVGNEAGRKERKIEFEYIPATGMKEEYVLQHFELPDGHNYAEEPNYNGPEIAVNVTNGNVVFHERDFKVQGERAELELERVYNSQQPSEKDTQWGHGWTLAQSPELKPQSGETPVAGTMLKTGTITNPVKLPETQAQPTFNQKLHAEIGKTSGGGYEVNYETAPEVSVFAASGKIQETRLEADPGGVTGSALAKPEPVPPTYVSSFGSAGTGNGQFAHPADIALDAKGNIWVADENNNRLQEFNPKGEFLKTLGSAGTGNGQFAQPKSIAFDAKGNFWVADAGHSRLQEFNEKGEFIKTAGAAGSGNGQFNGPESIAIDAKGNIWVADTYNYRVQELNEKGEFIKVVNPSGLGAIEPTGLDIGPGGNVWVADWAHNRVVEFSEEGALVRQFGSTGTGAGQFKQPDSVTIDSRGDVWVTDQNNERVQEFNQNGAYVSQFGAAGSGAGQFSFGYPTGIGADSQGNLWVTDTSNNRIQKWTIPGYSPSYVSSFGSGGTGNGQFAHPGDIAVDAEGNLWVVDENNNRVEEFNSAGTYVTKFGSAGTGNGQFSRPTSIAISPQGNIWVADAGNCRLEEFNGKGEYLAKTGSCGTGNGQFGAMEGIAISPQGNIWVADTYHARLQELNEKGEFVRAVGTSGTGPGQLCEPTGIDIGPGGNVWTTEWCNNRVSEFNEKGEFIRKFGTAGAGNGQFAQPDAVTVDANGNVWVGDQNNNRVQEFNQGGEYLTQFGSAGSGNGQFSFGYPMGIGADSKGHLWITDTGNNRVQRFSAQDSINAGAVAYFPAPTIKYSYSGSNLTQIAMQDPATSSDPAIKVEVGSGLTTGVNAEAAGTASLSYESNKLKSETDPEGQTKYGYDASNRLNSVELANGTIATITYDTSSRATAVKVDPAGPEAAKTTNFFYTNEPRQTIVFGGGNPEVTYSIGEDGSVFKWSYAEVPPTIDSVSGSIWGNRNSTTPVENKDQTLVVIGSSPHEIAKVQVDVNGEAVLAEKTCEDKSEPPAHNCEHVTLEWVTNPAEHAAGQLNLEVLVTDFLGHTSAERFFVTMPQQPPPDPEAPPKPSFETIKQFREDFGLDREHSYTEQQMTTLILELLYEWELEQPNAMRSVEKWGVPLRGSEIAELEFRERYIEQFAELIPEWAQEHAASTYGGYYVDNRAGGIIYVGFTANQQSQVEAVKQIGGLLAPGQIREYPIPPTTALATVETTEEAVGEALEANPTVNAATTEIGTEPGSSVIRVGATNPTLVQEYLSGLFGPSANIQTFFHEEVTKPSYSRYTTNGPINPGDALMSTPKSCGENRLCWESCTAGFSGRDVIENREGHDVYAEFALTAGHCFEYLELANRDRSPAESASDAKPLGVVRRRSWGSPGDKRVTDAEAIRIDPNIRSGNVFVGNPNALLPMHGLTRTRIGSTLCWSGINGGVHCGAARRLHFIKYDGRWTRQVEVPGGTASGDSGGPVWNPKSLKAVGITTARTITPVCHEIKSGAEWCWLNNITPLMPYGNRANPFGALEVLHLELVRGDF